MKHILLSVVLIACVRCASADTSAVRGPASVGADSLCATVFKEDDFIAGGKALEALAQLACAEKPDACVPDAANRDAFLGLNAALLKQASAITRPALEAFFKQGPQPTRLEFYELGYIFDTLLLKRVSDTVCAGASTALEKAERLNDWMFEHVAASSPMQKRLALSRPAYPLDVIERAHGLDFQLSWTLAALAQQQGLAVALAYLPEGTDPYPVLVLVFLEEGSVFVDPARGIVWKDPATRAPIGIREAPLQPGAVAGLHSQYTPAMAGATGKALFRIPYHPLALLPKMKTLQSVLANACGDRPLLYIDLARAHSVFGRLFCRAEGIESFAYKPELMEFTLPGRDYSCGVWLLPLVQLFAMGMQDAPQYREARRMHLRGAFDQASLRYRHALAGAEEGELRAELTFLLGLLEYDRGNYRKAAVALQRYLDRHFTSHADHVRFLLARICQIEGDRTKCAEFKKTLRGNPRYERRAGP